MALGDEIANLDFASMIGGPLNAVIKAQAQSAITSVDFIKTVGFDKDGKVEQVEFLYTKSVPAKDAQGNPTGQFVDAKQKLSVPLLTMLPIPFIRVEETTIDFNAKINSVQESTTASSHDLNASLGVKAGWGPVSAELKVSYSYKKSTSATEKTERTYSMAIHVRAVQDELPAGTERLLSILENSIKETAAA
jgi:hypothetical protein